MHLKSEARLFLESSQHYNQVQSTLKTINSTSSPKEQCRDNSIISILRAANGLTLVQDGKGSSQRQRCFAGNIPDLRLTHVISMSHADQLFPCKLITNMLVKSLSKVVAFGADVSYHANCSHAIHDMFVKVCGHDV